MLINLVWPKNNQWHLILIVGVFGFYHQSKSNPVLQIDDANNHIYPFKTDEDESSLSSNYAFQTSSKGEKGDRVSENYFHTALHAPLFNFTSGDKNVRHISAFVIKKDHGNPLQSILLFQI